MRFMKTFAGKMHKKKCTVQRAPCCRIPQCSTHGTTHSAAFGAQRYSTSGSMDCCTMTDCLLCTVSGANKGV